MEPGSRFTRFIESNGQFRWNRRAFLQAAATTGAAALLPACKRTPKDIPPTGEAAAKPESVQLVEYPEKTKLILLTDRPPQLETPMEYFKQDLTPNEAFFVRWHLSMIPTPVDLGTFRLKIDGHVDQPQSFSVDDLRKMDSVSVVAVNQCSGNSRQYFQPRVPGGQWSNGAMGNAKWTGVRLRDLLDRAKVKNGAVDVSFTGLDRGAMPSVPIFTKSLAFDHAMDGEVMVAYEMNGAPLPMLNGFPLRLVVPGWFGTYWVKSLAQISVLPEKFEGFWMAKAYRVPNTPGIQEDPLHQAKDMVPISKMLVRSLFVTPEPDAHIPAGQDFAMEGVAFDGGNGIRLVEVSTDGQSWYAATLDPEVSKFAWRRWRFTWKPTTKGKQRIMVRASNTAGQTQPAEQWNRGGYARNVVEQINVTVA